MKPRAELVAERKSILAKIEEIAGKHEGRMDGWRNSLLRRLVNLNEELREQKVDCLRCNDKFSSLDDPPVCPHCGASDGWVRRAS